ncbi:MAG TPA: SDR family oxidoreductase [Longimicrobiales bacterium]
MVRPIGKQALVITGASSGIGLVTARLAARRGARVALAARNALELERVVEGIRREGGEAIAVPTDVADYRQVESLAQRAVHEFGRIDTWVNGAAVGVYGAFADVPAEDFRQVIEVTFMGQVHGAKAALPHLEAAAGTLICVGSVLGDHGVPLLTSYSAAKHALEGWLDGLRLELERRGSRVRVTLIKPAPINTPFYEKARTYLGVAPRPLRPVYAPELAARAILDAAERAGPPVVYVGSSGKAFALAARASPWLADLCARWYIAEGHRTHRPKAPDAPSNLYAPTPSDGGERGDWTGEEVERDRLRWLLDHPLAAALGVAALLGLTVLPFRGRGWGGRGARGVSRALRRLWGA